MANRIRIVCEECGSDDIVRDANARWNVETQEWELTNAFDKPNWCESEVCNGAEIRTVEEEWDEVKQDWVAVPNARSPYRSAPQHGIGSCALHASRFWERLKNEY